MDNKILVAYGSKYRATAGIARFIAQTLSEAGASVDILPVEQVTGISPYRAIVIGSAVYAGTWRKDVVEFLETHETTLTTRAIWIFSSGPTGDGDPTEIMHGWKFPKAQRALIERISPRNIAFFHGDIDTSRLNIGERLLVQAIGAKTGDFRDWETIRKWTLAIAETLEPAPSAVA